MHAGQVIANAVLAIYWFAGCINTKSFVYKILNYWPNFVSVFVLVIAVQQVLLYVECITGVEH